MGSLQLHNEAMQRLGKRRSRNSAEKNASATAVGGGEYAPASIRPKPRPKPIRMNSLAKSIISIGHDFQKSLKMEFGHSSNTRRSSSGEGWSNISLNDSERSDNQKNVMPGRRESTQACGFDDNAMTAMTRFAEDLELSDSDAEEEDEENDKEEDDEGSLQSFGDDSPPPLVHRMGDGGNMNGGPRRTSLMRRGSSRVGSSRLARKMSSTLGMGGVEDAAASDSPGNSRSPGPGGRSSNNGGRQRRSSLFRRGSSIPGGSFRKSSLDSGADKSSGDVSNDAPPNHNRSAQKRRTSVAKKRSPSLRKKNSSSSNRRTSDDSRGSSRRSSDLTDSSDGPEDNSMYLRNHTNIGVGAVQNENSPSPQSYQGSNTEETANTSGGEEGDDAADDSSERERGRPSVQQPQIRPRASRRLGRRRSSLFSVNENRASLTDAGTNQQQQHSLRSSMGSTTSSFNSLEGGGGSITKALRSSLTRRHNRGESRRRTAESIGSDVPISEESLARHATNGSVICGFGKSDSSLNDSFSSVGEGELICGWNRRTTVDSASTASFSKGGSSVGNKTTYNHDGQHQQQQQQAQKLSSQELQIDPRLVTHQSPRSDGDIRDSLICGWNPEHSATSMASMNTDDLLLESELLQVKEGCSLFDVPT